MKRSLSTAEIGSLSSNDRRLAEIKPQVESNIGWIGKTAQKQDDKRNINSLREKARYVHGRICQVLLKKLQIVTNDKNATYNSSNMSCFVRKRDMSLEELARKSKGSEGLSRKSQNRTYLTKKSKAHRPIPSSERT
jgi:hypothetical protein